MAGVRGAARLRTRCGRSGAVARCGRSLSVAGAGRALARAGAGAPFGRGCGAAVMETERSRSETGV
jgi:hypothetical protein